VIVLILRATKVSRVQSLQHNPRFSF